MQAGTSTPCATASHKCPCLDLRRFGCELCVAWLCVVHSEAWALSVFLSICLFFSWGQPGHPAEPGRGSWDLPPSPTPSRLHGALRTLDQLHQCTWSTGCPVSGLRLGAAGDKDAFSPRPRFSLRWASVPVRAAVGTGLAREGKASSGRRRFSLSCPFSCTVFALCNGRAACGMPGHSTGSRRAGWKPLLCSVPCQTSCGYVFGEGPPQRRPRLDYTSGVSRMPTSHLLPGIYWRRWRGATAFGVAQPGSAAAAAVAALAGLCWPPAERKTCISAPVFLFPQFNELVTPYGDAAVVMGAFCGGTCSFWHRVGKHGCAYGVSDTFAFSCCAPLGKKNQTRSASIILT